MKVIFLDIDGVMNSEIFYRERHNKLSKRIRRIYYKVKRVFIKSKGVSLVDYKIPDRCYTFEYQFKRLQKETDSLKWKWLTEFCNKEDINICISSVWKHHFGTKTPEGKYKSTPELWRKALVNLGFKEDIFVGITNTRKSLRGEEIKDWLDLHPEVIDYAILDDDNDMLPEQMDKFHHSDPYYGLTPNHLYRIKLQFNKSN